MCKVEKEGQVKIYYHVTKEITDDCGDTFEAEVFETVTVDESKLDAVLQFLAENNRIYDNLGDPDDGRCPHGTYVGGCGIDWMCGRCEEGLDWDNDYGFVDEVGYRFRDAGAVANVYMGKKLVGNITYDGNIYYEYSYDIEGVTDTLVLHYLEMYDFVEIMGRVGFRIEWV